MARHRKAASKSSGSGGYEEPKRGATVHLKASEGLKKEQPLGYKPFQGYITPKAEVHREAAKKCVFGTCGKWGVS